MNTVLVTVDALRADHLGQYGYERDTMPVLDELTESGIKFTQAYSNAPYTRISVPAIQASQYLAYTNLPEIPTLASLLNNAGVSTAVVGTQIGMNLVDGDFEYDEDIDLGRDEFHEQANRSRPLKEQAVSAIDDVATTVSETLQRFPGVYEPMQALYGSVVPDSGFRYLGYTSAAEVTNRAIEWLDANDGERFLWIHYMEGHRPYGVHDNDPEYLEASVGEERIRELMKTAGSDPEAISKSERELMIDLYDSDVRYCSRHLRRLFDRLKETGEWEDTNVVFTSDHGEEFGDHGRYFHRNYPYDELINVPLLVKTDQTASSTVTAQRELLDVAPTICEFHDVDVDDAGFLGRPLFTGEDRQVIVLGSGTADEGERTVAGRWDGWKYIRSEDTEQLYDLQTDPQERRNVADEHPGVIRRFELDTPDYLFEREAEVLTEPNNTVDREHLEALGYLELKND